MDWIDGEARRSLSTIREARVDGFVPRRREPVLCSAMGKNLAGTLLNGSEAPRPTEEEEEIVFSREQEEDGEDGGRPSARMSSLRGTDRTRRGPWEGRCFIVRGKGVRKSKTESKENGNKAEGKRRIKGEENRKASYNAAVISVSCVPRSGPPDWPAEAGFASRPVLQKRDICEQEDPALIRTIPGQIMVGRQLWRAARRPTRDRKHSNTL